MDPCQGSIHAAHHTCPNHRQAIPCGLRRDVVFTTHIRETVFRDRQLKVLLDFVITDHLTNSQSDRIFTMQRLACSLSRRHDLIRIFSVALSNSSPVRRGIVRSRTGDCRLSAVIQLVITILPDTRQQSPTSKFRQRPGKAGITITSIRRRNTGYNSSRRF